MKLEIEVSREAQFYAERSKMDIGAFCNAAIDKYISVLEDDIYLLNIAKYTRAASELTKKLAAYGKTHDGRFLFLGEANDVYLRHDDFEVLIDFGGGRADSDAEDFFIKTCAQAGLHPKWMYVMYLKQEFLDKRKNTWTVLGKETE